MSRRYDVVLFDLLTALLDSWSLWNAVAGSEQAGRRWRAAYLEITYRTGRYRPYEDLVASAAESAGLSRRLADDLAARYGEIEPWPEAGQVLRTLHEAGVPLGVVTNCSEALGRLAASRVRAPFSVIVTAERAGCYKPDPRPYQVALDEAASSRNAVCSSRDRPMTCSAPRVSGCRPGGMIGLACRCRRMPPRRSRITAH